MVQNSAAQLRRSNSQIKVMHNVYAHTYAKGYSTDDSEGNYPQYNGMYHYDPAYSCTEVASQ